MRKINIQKLTFGIALIVISFLLCSSNFSSGVNNKMLDELYGGETNNLDTCSISSTASPCSTWGCGGSSVLATYSTTSPGYHYYLSHHSGGNCTGSTTCDALHDHSCETAS